jgi:hypothetical protein
MAKDGVALTTRIIARQTPSGPGSVPIDFDSIVALPDEEDILLEGLLDKRSRRRDGAWQERRVILTERELVWAHVDGHTALDR